MTKEISAGIIIYHKTKEGLKFLLLYHGGGYWNFPKGKIEAEEKSFQAALRETKEETGLGGNDLKIDQRFKAYEKFVFWRGRGIKKEKVFKIVIFYLAETKRPQIRISYEHNGYGWFKGFWRRLMICYKRFFVILFSLRFFQILSVRF